MSNTHDEKMTIMLTRPSLVSKLCDCGRLPSLVTVSPWDSSHKAWIYELDDFTADTIATFYDNLGKPIPGAVSRYYDARRAERAAATKT